MSGAAFTCPCCGYRTLGDWPGSFDICGICFWEDDPVQLLDPAYEGGANGPSLRESQTNYARFGACQERLRDHVRAPRADEARDPQWRPVAASDLRAARTPRDLSPEENERLEAWYYWLRTST